MLVPLTSLPAKGATPPLHFEPNDGQAGTEFAFLARAPGCLLLFENDGTAVRAVFSGPAEESFRIVLENAQPAGKGQAEALLGSLTNFDGGRDPSRWQLGIPNYARLRFRDVYPGIDLVWHARSEEIEYEVVIRPGADARRIAWRMLGIREPRLDPEGGLVLERGGRRIRWRRLFAYQEGPAGREPVPAAYRIEGDLVRVELGGYDRDRELVIDLTVRFATYLGGSEFDAHGCGPNDAEQHAVSGRCRR